jgi:hypothetical protein
MSFKSEIKKAITANTKYTAVKVWKPEIEDSGLLGGEETVMTIEVTVRKKKPKKINTIITLEHNGCHNCDYHYQNGNACDAPKSCYSGKQFKPIK